MSAVLATGLTQTAAAAALARHGPNLIDAEARPSAVRELLRRFRNPLVLLLVAAAAVSALTGDAIGASLIVVTIAVSLALDFFQERRAGNAVERLREMVRVTARVRRDGVEREIALAEVVPGDVIVLAAGDLVPADGVLAAARDLYVNQATLTGESYPVEKRAAPVPDGLRPSPSDSRTVVMGSHVVSGMAQMVVVLTGRKTVLGETARLVGARTRPSPLEQGTQRFGLLLLRLTLFLALFVVLVNAVFGRPMLETFLFAVALAVGLTPELLPAVVSVTLARGALRLAREQVIVKRPGALYTLGAMDVLCTDKTGTLTEGSIELQRHITIGGQSSDRVLLLARVNSGCETGLRSPLDEAILRRGGLPEGWRKVDEVPFDFDRRRVSVLADDPDGRRLLIVKGAPEDLVARCDRYESDGRAVPLDDEARAVAMAQLASLGDAGMRVLAISWRELGLASARVDDEQGLVLAGFAAFLDPPRKDAKEALAALAARGVAVKVVTGDDGRVARHLCGMLAIGVQRELSGADIARLDDDALAAVAGDATVFSRVSPAQKTRVIAALQRRGHTVGYIGDGINDAPALRRADVGISVDGAVDVAKEAADVILLRHHLSVVGAGILEGRRSHANVMKYLRMGTSSNFGNMASMAGATLFLPFLPLLPVQVLLNNMLYDLSEMALPFDRCEEEELERPQAWDLGGIRRFMLSFGPLSSAFDVLTFGVLLWVFDAGAELFRTGWFIESVASQVLVIFAIRTRRPALRSAPHPALAAAAFAVVAAAICIPFLPGAGHLGFVTPPLTLLAMLGLLVACYLGCVELLKRRLI